MLYFAIEHEWIIFRTPTRNAFTINTHHITSKKQVNLFFWNRQSWKKETQELLWTEDTARNIQHLINAWLSLLDEEKLLKKKIGLETALLSPSGHEAYLSFDRNPLSKEQTIFEKWMIIEGLLKTLRENEVSLQRVQLLVHHKPLNDRHLDFSKPWPLGGFMGH